MAGTIGIKIANGDFYPIMEEKSTVKKRLVLTTVHDRQKSVQIDLFRSVTRSMLDAQYIGSLMVEDIDPRQKGEPSIEMVLSSDADGTITADACDLDAIDGERHVLNVSLKTMGPADTGDAPDFHFEDTRQTSSSRYERDDDDRQKSPWLIVVVVAIFIAIAAALLWLFLFDTKAPFNITLFNKDKPTYAQSAPPPPAEPPAPPPPPPEPPAPPPAPVAETPPPPPAEPAAEPVVIQAPTTPPPARPQTPRLRNRPPAPVSSYKVPAVIPKDGAPYQLRWGDTLWDVSEAFYRDPWLYPRIARFNNISNPDVIVSGRTIRVPPKN